MLHLGSTTLSEDHSEDQVSFVLHTLEEVSQTHLTTAFIRVTTKFIDSSIASVSLNVSITTELTISLALGVFAFNVVR